MIGFSVFPSPVLHVQTNTISKPMEKVLWVFLYVVAR